METVLNVVIADVNEAFAESLKSTLEQNGGFSVVGISGDGEVILDTMLPIIAALPLSTLQTPIITIILSLLTRIRSCATLYSQVMHWRCL